MRIKTPLSYRYKANVKYRIITYSHWNLGMIYSQNKSMHYGKKVAEESVIYVNQKHYWTKLVTKGISREVEELNEQQVKLLCTICEKDSAIEQHVKTISSLSDTLHDNDTHHIQQNELVTNLQIEVDDLKYLVAKQMKNIETEATRYHSIKEESERNSTNMKAHIDQLTVDITNLDTNLIDSVKALDVKTTSLIHQLVKQLLNKLQK